MRHCPELATEFKRHKERCQKPTINLVDNFEDSSSEEELVETDPDFAVNLIELNLIENSKDHEWYIDSGATRHVTGRSSLLRELQPGGKSKISTTRGETLKIVGKGNVVISTNHGEIKFDEVLYVRGITKNLLSVGSITDKEDRPKDLIQVTCGYLKTFLVPNNIIS